MSDMVPLYGFGGAGGSGGKIAVTAPAGATVTVSKDGKSKTKVAGSDGVALFQGLDSGAWRVTLYNEDGSESFCRNVAVTVDYAAVVDFFDGYLYNAGDECEVFSGGWACDDSDALDKGTSNMILLNSSDENVATYAFSGTTFDTTGYSRIIINCKRYKANAYFGIASADKTIVSRVMMPNVSSLSSSPVDVTLDISGYQGDYLLYFSCVANTTSYVGRAYVYSVKIE